jgi:predicted permease
MIPFTPLRIQRLLLKLLSPLAPGELRTRWQREWEGEAHHWKGPGLLVAATRDALHLRFFRPLSASEGHHPRKQQKDRSMVASLFTDIRFSFRTLRSAPWFSAVTVLTLALGIGSSVAMFGVLHSVFLKPLPFPDAQELVVGRATFQGHLNPWVAGADYYDYRDESTAFQELAAVLPWIPEVTYTGGGEASRIRQNVASPNLFRALGVTPALGRTFLPEDGLVGAEDQALLSHAFWQSRMESDPEVLGTTVTLDGNPYTVVGVLPKDFYFLAPADLWVPMRPDRMAASSRGNHNWYLVGRLRDGVTLRQAQAQVDGISTRLQEEYPETNADKALLITGLRDVLTEDYRTTLWLLSAAVGLVLLIACGNGAGILLARAPTRRFELSVRAAMGAPRIRLIRQLLAESLGLSLLAGTLGVVLAIWFQKAMLNYLNMDRLGLEGSGLSLPLLLAALGASLFAGLLSGVYPALSSAGVSPTEGLKSGHRGHGDGGSRFRSGLVVVQVALSITLLAGSGLMIRSLSNLQSLDPGFQSEGVLTAEVQIPRVRYPTGEDRTRFFSNLLQEVRGIPGVQAATLASHLPIGDQGNTYRATAQGSDADPERIFMRPVFPGYFDLLDIPLLSGRDFGEADGVGSPWVVILSQTAAQRLFPEGNAMGRVVEFSLTTGPRPMEVVGVVGDVRLSRLEDEPEAALYVPYAHRFRTEMRLAMETQLSAASLTGSLREILQRLDPEVPLSRVTTLEELVLDSMADRRVVTLSLTLLALLPLVLAAVGLFAVLAYHVSRRKHEIGIRMALGADASDVSKMILGQGLKMVAVGICLGLGGAVVGTRILEGLLFGIQAKDPLTLLMVAALVTGVAVLACLVPVWRATRADPRVALETE